MKYHVIAVGMHSFEIVGEGGGPRVAVVDDRVDAERIAACLTKLDKLIDSQKSEQATTGGYGPKEGDWDIIMGHIYKISRRLDNLEKDAKWDTITEANRAITQALSEHSVRMEALEKKMPEAFCWDRRIVELKRSVDYRLDIRDKSAQDLLKRIKILEASPVSPAPNWAQNLESNQVVLADELKDLREQLRNQKDFLGTLRSYWSGTKL